MGDLPELMEIDRGGQIAPRLPRPRRRRRRGDAAGFRITGEGARAAPPGHCGSSLLRSATASASSSVHSKNVALGPLKAGVVAAALTRTFLQDSVPTTQPDFARRLDEGRSRFNLIAQEIARTASGILAERAAIEKKLELL